ncbi:MAG: alpha-tubulin suppressor-like RCC1 family protein, partial [Myxococcota bacterium]
QPDTRYYFTVRPKDAAGNLDSNTFVATIKTSGVAQAMAIAIGDGQSCAFLSNGQLQCWGDNPVTETQTLTSVAIGGSHVCIIDAFANLQCRGANQFGQLGTGTQVGNTTFTDIMSDVRHVVTGPSHTCALKTDGTVFCWGRNINNAVGPGPEVVDTPQQIELEDGSILVGIVKLFAGGDHNCVIRGDGETLCWGFNYAGQSSSQDLFHVKYPTQVDVTDALGFIDMALGEAHTCGVSADGRVFCFGVNSDGQLGLGAAGPGAATTPTDIGLANAVAVGAGASHSCAVLADGTARCWGNNESGQLGVGLTANVVKTPTLVTTGDPAAPVTLERVVDIDASTDHGCALLADGELRCWGANTAGELGIGGAAESIVATKVTVLKGLSHLTGLARHSKHSCAVLSDGSGRCWGANDAGQVGATPTPAAPVTVLDGLSKGRVLDVQPGGSHTCALEVGGKVLCWGSNSEGQLGAIVGDTHLPVEVVLPSAAREVATGGRHSCAVLSTGDVWCWGANDRGQLGDDGNTEPAFLPSPVDGMTGPGSLAALSLIAGEDHTCAIVAGQGQFSARCWGANTWLQLGSAAGGDQNTPQPVILLTGTPVSLSAGLVHTCAVLEDGTSTCWGSNSDDQSVPAQDMSGTSLIAAGATHTCALDSVGQAYCWGDGTSGQLGLSSTISHDSPQNLLLAARGIVSGDGSSCALSHGGFAFCWGANTGDELGTGGPDPQTFAAEVQCLP